MRKGREGEEKEGEQCITFARVQVFWFVLEVQFASGAGTSNAPLEAKSLVRRCKASGTVARRRACYSQSFTEGYPFISTKTAVYDCI